MSVTRPVLVLKLEPTADRVGSLVPLYDELKLILLLALILLRQPVAVLIFDQLISPLLSPYETPIDALGYALGQLIAFATACVLWPARRALDWWRPREPDVPAILAGLRVNNRPGLARDLADSIEQQTRMDERNSNWSPRPAVDQAGRVRKTAAGTARAGVKSGVPVASSGAARRSAGRGAAVKAATTVRTPAATSTSVATSSLDTAVVRRPRPAKSTLASASSQEAQTTSLLASLPAAPSTALVSYLPPPPPPSQQERVTLAIPPPPPPPSPPPPEEPAIRHTAAPTPPQPFRPVRPPLSSHASSLTDTPLAPGSFFGARPKPTRPAATATPPAAAATPPGARVSLDSPARRRTSIGSAAGGAATPKQKALRAIADLSPQVDGEEAAGGLEWGRRPAKKAKVSPVARTTRRGRKAAEEGEEAYEEEVEEQPRRKKVATGLGRSTTRRATEEVEEGGQPPRKRVAGAGVKAVGTKPSAKRKPSGEVRADSDEVEEEAAPAPRSSRSARPAPLEPAAVAGRRSRAAALADRESSPPPTGSSETFSLPVPKRRGRAGVGQAKERVADSAPVAPARKARRVLVAKVAVGAGSDEEIDGVPVARGVGAGAGVARRSARK